MKKNPPYSLIAKKFADQCTEAEKEFLLFWRQEDTQHEYLFEILRHEWNEIGNLQKDYTILDKEEIWEKIKAKQNLSQKKNLEENTAKPTKLKKHFIFRRIVAIAAVILLLVANGLFLYYYTNKTITSEEHLIVYTSPGQKSKLVLPDSTIVWLNSGSSITYPSSFNTLNRSISLQGEAYFQVKKSAEHPFMVHTDQLRVKVMGTTFNVKAFNEEPNVSVALVEGHVRLLYRDSDKVLTDLTPNQLATINRNNMEYIVSTCDAEQEGLWHMNKLRIVDYPIDEIWKKIELWYGVKIKVSSQKPDVSYRFTVKTESLTELLFLINKLTPIEYEINGEEVTIRYK